MTQLTSDLLVTAQELFSSSSTKEHALGERAVSADGRRFRYALCGGTTLVVGNLLQSPAEVTAHQDLTPTAAAIGATAVTVTLGATLATANQYTNGYLVVTATPGEGYMYKIKSHPAADASATLELTLYTEDALQVAVTASSTIDLVLNPYSGVIANPTTATGSIVGAAVYPIATTEYGWIQTGGSAALLDDGTGVGVGVNVSASNGTAGAIEAAVTAQAAVGVARTGIAASDIGAVYLTLD
jgi:hypothetical protein